MLLYYLLFFFVTFGANLLLGLLTIYLLLPDEERCSRCDGATLLIRPRRVGRIAAMLTARRVSWRWCPACGAEGPARVRGARPAGRAGRRSLRYEP